MAENMDVLHNGRIETRIGDPVPQQDSIFGYILKPFWKSLGLFWCALSAYIQTLARRKALTYIVQPSIAAWTKIAKVFKTTPHFQQEKPHEFAYQQAALIGSTFVNTAVTLTLGNLLGVVGPLHERGFFMDNPQTLATYSLQYIGRIPVTVSIKSLDFHRRTKITRECIQRVCEDVGLRVPQTFQPQTSDISDCIGRATDLTWTRKSVRLTICVDGVTVQDFHSNQILFHHRLASVSFASSGEADLLDYVSYIAKNENPDDASGLNQRLCYVFYCSEGCSRDFIACIGEAFKQGYRGYKQTQKLQGSVAPPPTSRPIFDDFEPPEVFAPAAPVHTDPWNSDQLAEPRNAPSDNRFFEDAVDDNTWLLQDEPTGIPHDNWVAFPSSQQVQASSTFVDQNVTNAAMSTSLEPIGEPWYVGRVSRQRAEALLQYDGDFLVRASTQQVSQFVLSGVQNGKKRHLLLINPEGQVRTKDRVFKSIQELIDYHLRSNTPIRSADSELKLVFPVTIEQ